MADKQLAVDRRRASLQRAVNARQQAIRGGHLELAARIVSAIRVHERVLARLQAQQPPARRICPTCDLPPTGDCAFANCKREWAEPTNRAAS